MVQVLKVSLLLLSSFVSFAGVSGSISNPYISAHNPAHCIKFRLNNVCYLCRLARDITNEFIYVMEWFTFPVKHIADRKKVDKTKLECCAPF